MRLTASPHNLASEHALAIYGKVLDAVRADVLVHQAIQRAGDSLFVQGRMVDLTHYDRVWVCGSGKASVEMAKAVAEVVGDRLAGGLIVTKTGQHEKLAGIEVLEAAHPVPDSSSLQAGDRLIEFAQSKTERDLVLFVLSGGSSALTESVRDPVTLEELQLTNQILLGAGVDIVGMNDVRSRLSRIKAGGLARAFAPATVIALVLSDVAGNDLRTIGSGPLMLASEPGRSIPSWLVDRFPSAVRDLLAVSMPLPPPSEPIEHVVIGGISLAIHAAVEAARELGLRSFPYADPLKGEARAMASKICDTMKKWPLDNGCMIFGGETTVTLKGDGLGGRCQEMALAAAKAISESPDTCFLAAGTDGADGPTDAAGGIVDPGSLERSRQAGFHRSKSLTKNDAYHYLEACGGLIKTGPTGSNVNDLVLVVHAAD